MLPSYDYLWLIVITPSMVGVIPPLDDPPTDSTMATSIGTTRESKEDFLERIKGLLSEKGLKVEDLQVKLKEEDVDHFMNFIGKDWYTFGRCMGVEDNVMEHIKKTGKDKPGRKKQLLQYLIKLDHARYEDIIYGLYNSENKQDPSINDILDYIYRNRKIEVPGEFSRPQRSSSGPPYRTAPRRNPSTGSMMSRSKSVYRPPVWKAKYDERKKCQPSRSKLRPLSELSPDKYQDHFYGTLWYEEREHMEKLKKKCDGKYSLFIYSGHGQDVPQGLQSDSQSYYGYIKGSTFTDDKIEYATQASDSVVIADKHGSPICTAYKDQYNFGCLENQMYIRFRQFPLAEIKEKCTEVEDGCFEIHAKFEVKHSYFNHLQEAVVRVPDYIRVSLIPQEQSFMPLFPSFKPVYSSSLEFMKLDTSKQFEALQMITSTTFQLSPVTPPPPVILYGPFGSGKTRILARAAYEVMMNGMYTRRRTRILICAHHPQSIDIFIYAYFGRIEREGSLPFKVIEISRFEKGEGVTFGHFYITVNRLSQQQHKICQMEYLIVIATYTMSLNLQSIFKEGFFTHVFLDEAAQVREPEAITPLAMASRDAKIVLAGDDKQVGPNILVLGEEARKYELHISLLERMMQRYDTLGPVAQSYVTKLSVNYRSHESLMPLPELFYRNLRLNYDKHSWQHRGPTGYSFVCSDSRLVPSYIDPNHPLVEACIVLEEVLQYLKKIKETGKKIHPRSICIISSTRKQLNQIKDMAYDYKEYKELRGVSFQPSFMIQGHEFEAIFLGLFEPVENDEMGAFFIKSLFNPYVFNTVITRARTRVVAFGKPKVVIDFENKSPHDGQYNMKFKCWHEYLKLCIKNGTLQHCESVEELEELMKPKSTVVTKAPTSLPTSTLPKATLVSTPRNVSTTPVEHVPSVPSIVHIPTKHVPSVPTKHVPSVPTLPVVHHSVSSNVHVSSQPISPSVLEEQGGSNLRGLSEDNEEDPWPYFDDHQNSVFVTHALISAIPMKEVGSDYLTDMITDTVDENKKVFYKISQLQKGFEHLQQDLETRMRLSLETKLHRRCEELTKENEILRRSLREAAQKTIVDPSTSTVVARLEVSIRSDDAQRVNWKEYGMNIIIPQGMFPFSNEDLMNESITIEALAGGKFQFPDGMNLVSAVYAISVTKPLSKPIELEIEHCVNLTDKAELEYLKFAVAPHESGPPYKFQYVEGGRFAVGSRYGGIARDTFSLFCIGIEGEANDDDSSSSDEDEQMAQENDHDEPEEKEEEGGGEGGGGGGGDDDNEEDEHENDKEGQVMASTSATVESKTLKSEPNETSQIMAVVSSKGSSSQSDKKRSRNSLSEKVIYNGLMLSKNHETLVIFAASKNLAVLFKFLESSIDHTEDESVDFCFTDQGYIELIFENETQKKPITGWDVHPHSDPCQLTRKTIDKFGSIGKPAKLFINVYPDTSNKAIVSTLCYCIPLKGIEPPKSMFIIRSLEMDKKVKSPTSMTADQSQPNQGKQQQLKEVASDILRKPLISIFKLLSDETNRFNVAFALYSNGLITENNLEEATSGSPQSNAVKGKNLAMAIKAKIDKDPESLIQLIAAFEEIEEFQKLAKDMKNKI